MMLSVGARLGPYEILGPFWRGGMGEVWKARVPESVIRAGFRDIRLSRTPLGRPRSPGTGYKVGLAQRILSKRIASGSTAPESRPHAQPDDRAAIVASRRLSATGTVRRDGAEELPASRFDTESPSVDRR